MTLKYQIISPDIVIFDRVYQIMHIEISSVVLLYFTRVGVFHFLINVVSPVMIMHLHPTLFSLIFAL